METPKEYYYVYYSYEEYGRGYIGSRGCKCLPEEDVRYFGSFYDKTFNPTQKIILKSDYATREEAYADEIILHEFYDIANNPHFANQSKQTSTKFYYIIPFEEASKRGKINGKINGMNNRKLKRGIFAMTEEERSELGKRNGKVNYKNKVGLFAMSKEAKREAGLKGGNKCKELRVGVCGISPENRKANSSKSGRICKENGLGIFSLSKEQQVEIGRKAGLLHKENKTGVCGIPPEEHSKRMIKINNQRWMCLETGHISNAGGLSRYQNKRDIDNSKRVRLT
jgi:general stress protein YciG